MCLQTSCDRQARHVIQLGLWSLLVQYCFLLLCMDTPRVHMGKAIMKWVIYLTFACTIEAWSYFLPRESARARWSMFGMLFYSTESLALLLLMPMKGRASSLNYYILPLRNNSRKETAGLQEYICEPFPSWLHGHLSDSPKLWAHWSGINGHSVVDCPISEKDLNTRHHKEGMA